MKRVLLVSLAGCGVHVFATPLHPSPEPVAHSRDARDVEILAGVPPRPHVAFYVLEAKNAWGGSSSADRLIVAMRQRAGQLGCDGLVLTDVDHEPKGKSRINGFCIVYTPAWAERYR